VIVTFYHRKMKNSLRKCSIFFELKNNFVIFIIENFSSHLTEESLLKLTHETNLLNIVELNLSCCNLQSMKILSELKNLRSLNFSFNELIKLDDLCYFYSLESIDLSYNRLVSLDGMKGLTKLNFLFATNNFLKKSLDDLLTLKKYCTSLVHLDLRGNSFEKVIKKSLFFY